MKRLGLSVLLAIAPCLLMTGRLSLARGVDFQAAQPGWDGQNTPAPSSPIDINTASLEELMKAPGMTRIWAARIIRFRPYRGKNELLEKGIVSSQVYDRIKDYIIARRIRQ